MVTHVIAIALPDVQRARRMGHRFDAANIAHESDVIAHPFPNGFNFAAKITRRHAFDNGKRLISHAHIGVANAGAHGIAHVSKCLAYPRRPRWDVRQLTRCGRCLELHPFRRLELRRHLYFHFRSVP